MKEKEFASRSYILRLAYSELPVKLTHPMEFPDENSCSSSAGLLLSVCMVCQAHLPKLHSGFSFLDTSQLLFSPCVTSVLFPFF